MSLTFWVHIYVNEMGKQLHNCGHYQQLKLNAQAHYQLHRKGICLRMAEFKPHLHAVIDNGRKKLDVGGELVGGRSVVPEIRRLNGSSNP